MTDVRPTAPTPEPGPLPDRLGERFELGELLGRGTCSEVYRAHDLLLDREAAVKIFPVADDPRIEREVRLTASMDHPSLVPVYDVGHDAGRAFVVMALLEGGSLTDRLAGGPLGVGETLLAVASVADGLSHVHRAGVLHRDVTPRNVLFDGDGRAHLSDFGVAFVADAPRITDTGIFVGSAPYLAPEQVRGETVGAPADVYALGLVMIEALTARPAYEGAPLAAARARLERRPEMPPGLEIEVLALLEAMTADDPRHRPTAENVCIGLRRAALAAEAATPPYAMAPIVGAGTPDATTENLRPVAAATPLGAEPASDETPSIAEVPERRRRRLADAGGFMVAASVAAAVLLAGGVVVASAWTVDRVNTATPPAATVPPPTAEVVADPGGGFGGGHSSSSSDDDEDRDRSSADDSDQSGTERQAVAERRAPTTAPETDGGAATTGSPAPSSSTTPSPTGTTTSGTTTTSTTSSSSNLIPGVPLPTITLPTTTSPTTQSTPDSSSSTAPSTTQPTTTSATPSSAPTSESTTTDTSTTTSHTTTTSPTTTTTTTPPAAARSRALLDPAVEALGGLLRR